MSTLYRKYRPQSFTDVIGQNHVKITLQNEIAGNQIGHAYLFCGPRGLGKTTLARLFAKAVNCENRKDGESEPCNECRSCTGIVANSSVDIIEIDAASHTGVDNVRENIIENARFTPNVSQYKVFIIDEVHMLSISAFNALLKTLEEPPAHAIFILCTTEIHKLPQTIISRCQRFDLRKVASGELKEKLRAIVKAENKKVDDSVFDNIVLHSEGCVRDAESLLGKILTLGDTITAEQAEIIIPRSDFSQIAGLLDFIADNQTGEAIRIVNDLVEDGVDLQSFTDNLLEYLRKIMLIKVSGLSAPDCAGRQAGALSDFGIELDEDSQKSAEGLAEKFDYGRLLLAIELFMKKRQEIKSALIQQLPLEVAIIELTEESASRKDEDDDGGDKAENTELSRTQRVKEKIKDGLSHLNPIKHKEKESAVILENIDLPKEKFDEIKVDMASSDDKLTDQVSIKYSKVKENWREIVVKLLEENYTLSSLLRISEPLKCDGNVIELAVKSKFYYDRLMDNRGRPVIERIISEVLCVEVKIKPIIKENVTPIPMEIEGINSVAEASQAPMAASQSVKPIGRVKKPIDAAQDVIGMF